MTSNFTSVKSICSNSASGKVKVIFIVFLSLFIFQSVNAGSPVNTPVQYNEISVLSSGANLILSWQANKSTFNHFEVEKSLDGNHFTTIGLVLDAPENSNTCLFRDKKSSNSHGTAVWYRLKSINKDGTIEYSSSTYYNLTLPVTDCRVTVNPNPFNTVALFKFNSFVKGTAEVKLLNLSGETLLSKQSDINKGANSIQVEGLGKLNHGMYSVQLLLNGVIVDNQMVIKE